LLAAGTDSCTCISEEVSNPCIPRRPHTSYREDKKTSNFELILEPRLIVFERPNKQFRANKLRISSSKKKLWKNKHATITSVLPLLLMSTSDALFFIKYFEASDFMKLLSY
jgi:hypothetical protein